MTMRYAHLSPAFLSAEVSLLDPPPTPKKGKKGKRARKGQRRSKADQLAKEAREFVWKNGSPQWTISATGSSVRQPEVAVCRYVGISPKTC
jgi:hypothetical protein